MEQSVKPSISFFCPAYYDEGNLPRLIPEVVDVLSDCTSAYDILIIEDGSPDRTGAVADELAERFPHVRVIHHPVNYGYGATIAEGFRLARKYEWVLTTDGDRQYDIHELSRFLPYLNDADAVIGYRPIRALSPYRLLQTWAYNQLIRTVLGLRVKDVNTSFKMVRRSCLERFPLHCQSSFIDAEMLVKLSRSHARIREVAVSHRPRKFGIASGAKPHVVLATVRDLVTFRLRGDLILERAAKL